MVRADWASTSHNGLLVWGYNARTLTHAHSHTLSCNCLPSTGGSDPIFCCYCWMSGKKARQTARDEVPEKTYNHSENCWNVKKKVAGISSRNRTLGFHLWICNTSIFSEGMWVVKLFKRKETQLHSGHRVKKLFCTSTEYKWAAQKNV